MDMAQWWFKDMLDDPKFSVDVKAERDILEFLFEDPKPVLGIILENIRLMSGMTYAEVAEKLGLKSRSDIKELTSGKRDTGIEKLMRTSCIETMGK